MGGNNFLIIQIPYIMKTLLCFLLALCTICFNQQSYAAVKLICPGEINLGCNPNVIPKPNPNKLEYETDCKKAKVKLINEQYIEDPVSCKIKLILTYEATDECGDTDRCDVVIHWIQDNQPPLIINCLADVDLGCNPEFIPAPNPNDIDAVDNCGIKEIVFHSEKLKKNKCDRNLTREYRVYDHCGNYSKCIQTIKWIVDIEPPEITCKDISLGCNFSGNIPPPDPSTIKAKDNCCLRDVIHLSDSDITVFGCEYSLLRLWEAVDCCGNRSTCTQRISWINDTTPPVFVACPPSLDLGCNPSIDDLSDPSINYVAAEDECGDVNIELVLDLTQNEGCEYKRIQRWKATDECGNMSFCERTISYSLDNSPPIIIECPPDLELGCVETGFEIPDATP